MNDDIFEIRVLVGRERYDAIEELKHELRRKRGRRVTTREMVHEALDGLLARYAVGTAPEGGPR